MAVKPSNAALTALRNTRREKQNELVGAYTAMGGSDTALLAKPTIPKLESAIDNLYQTAQNGGRSTYADRQAMSNAYNDYANSRTSEKLKHVKSESLAQLVSQPTIMGMSNAMYGNLTQDMKDAGLTLEDLERYNKAKSRQTYEDVASQIGADHPIIATGLAAAEQPLMSLGNVAKNVKNYALGNPIENNFNPATALRQSVAENNIDTKVGNFAYGVGNSMADMLIASLAGGNVGPGIMGLEKADEVMNNAVDRGLTPNQIMAEGVGSAITTALTERIPFKEFKAGNNIGRAMVSEGLQEGSEDIADTIVDILVTTVGGNPEKSEIARQYQAYLNMGMSEEDASKATVVDYLKQVGLDAVAGAIAGGGMGGINNVSQGYNFFRGNTNANTETNVDENVKTDTEQTIPTLRDSRAEEANIQARRDEELAQLTNAYSQIQQRQAEEQRRAEQLAREEAARNYDPEAMEFLRNIARETSEESQNWETRAEQLDRIENEVANEVSAEKERVIADLENQTPTAGEAVWNFEKYINTLIQQNPEMTGYLNAELNDVLGMAEGWVSDFDRYRQNQPTEYSDNVFDSREEAQDYLNDLSREDNIAEVIRREEENVLNSLDSNDPSANEKVGQFISRMNYIAQANPTMQGVVNNALNEVNARTDGLVEDYSRRQIQSGNTAFGSQEEAQSYLNNIQKRGEQARKAVDKFIDGVQSGKVKNVEKSAIKLMNTLTDYGKKIPELQPTLNSMWQEARAVAQPEQNIDEINNIDEAEQVLGNEVEKLDHTLRMNLGFYGNSKQSIPSVESNDVHTGIYKDSKLATNTFPNSGVMTEEEFNRVIPDDVKQYETVTHEETLNAAEKNIKDNGYTGEYNRLIGKDKWNAVDVDTAMLCAMKAAEDARNAEALGIDPNEAWSREVEIFKNARSQATAGGQMIEAFKKWSAMTAEGKLAQAISYVNEAVKEVKNENALPKDVKTAADRYLSDEVMAEFLKKAHQYDGQNPTLLQQARLNAELAHMINECIPVRFRNKFRSLWMDNLLASFRTLFSRNFGGNIGKAALDQTLVKMISGPVDNFISRYTGTRTTTGFTKEGLKTYAQGFKKGGKQTVKDYWTPNSDPDAELKLKDLAKDIEVFADANVTNRSGVDELNFKEAIRGNRTTFKNKAFKLYDKIIKFGLAIGDNPFYKGTYDQTVLELNTLREQGKLKLPEDITDAEFEQWVKVCATARGLEAVYQDNSELAQGAMDIKNGLAKVSNGFMGFDPLSNTAMPFVSTPMNVVKSNLELSPLGIVKNAAQTIKEIRSNLENGRTALDSQSFDQQRFVRETSRNIVGLLLFAAGLMLKNAGYLTGGYSDDPKEAQAQKDAGMQEYALVSPFTGNQWSINWIPGLGSTFAAASAFEDAYSKPDQDTADALINGAKAGAQSLFEQAALQGLQRLTGSANYNTDNKIVDNVVQTIANTASSAIVPSIARQSAAALDPYKRNTYGMGGKESVINNAIAGLPYLRTHMLEPRIGMNGQPIAQNAGRNTLEKWFDNLVNPAMVTVPSALANPVRDEATRLYEDTKDSRAFQPKISLNYLAVDGHVPTTEEYTEFLQIADTAMNQIASDFIQSGFYSTLPNEQRVDVLNDIYGTVQRVERAKYLGIDKDFDGADKAYFEGGAEGLTNYLTASTALNQLGLANNDKNREAVLSALERNGSESLPNIVSNYEDNVHSAWQQLNLGGEIDNRYSGMDSFFNDEQYEDLTNDMSSTIRTVEANRAIGYDREYTEAAKAYANGGVQGLVEYLYPATLLKQYGMDNNEKNRQGIMDAYNEGGASAVRSQLNAMQVFSGTAYGDGLNYRYNHATNYLPSLTPSQFASLYDTVDQQDKGTSGFNTITQQEVIDYLNRDPGAYNSETAMQYWNAFDQHAGSDDQWKKIPVLVNGEWQAKKA